MSPTRVLFDREWILALLAVVLLGLLFWFIAPFAGLSTVGRLIGLLALVIAWAVFVQWRSVVVQRRGAALARAVSAQPDAPVVIIEGSERDRSAMREVRERFDRAIALLRTRGRMRNLYELPWYVLIGAPGSGKTTALLNAGLEFPLATTELGLGALEGVGGTRNCEWYLTDSAILLDTAGRFVTQDSDRIADRVAWQSFLSLLRKHRRRQPINGVLLTVSVPDLVAASDAERERHAVALRSRMRELQEELRMPYPVYVLLTKSDLIAGFDDFFDDLQVRAERGQVLGVTFPLDASRRGQAVPRLPDEMNRVVERLQQRIVTRLADERDVIRRANIAAFPAQIAGLTAPLAGLLTEVFRPSELDGVWLRGCYFTSGTQGGPPIDRLIATMADTFGIELRNGPTNSQRGTSYFLETLLKKVVFQESGLAGVNERVQWRLAVSGIVAYAAIGAIFVTSATALVVSYRENQDFVTEFESLERTVLSSNPAPDESLGLEEALNRLDALALVRARANQERESPPLRMRWGLFQGETLGSAADDAYRSALNGVLGPWVSQHLAQRIRSAEADPERLYEYLKAYLLLGTPAEIGSGSNRAQLQSIGRVEWGRAFASRTGLAEQLSMHYAAWVDGRVTAIALDERLVEQARSSLFQASLPVLMYTRLRLSHANASQDDLRLDRELVLGGDALFVRRSGLPLSDPLPALYTKEAFDRFIREGRATLVQQFFIEDKWVFGERAPPIAEAPSMLAQVLALYEDDYIRAWEELLSDLTLRSFRDVNDALAVLGLLGAPTSPLKNVVLVVERHTNLTRPSAEADALATSLNAAAAALSDVNRIIGSVDSNPPGARVTAHFAAIHRLVEGPPGSTPIDRTLAELAQLQQEFRRSSGGAEALIRIVAAIDAVGAPLPPFVNAVVRVAGANTSQVASGELRNELASLFGTQVVGECAELIGSRYPANPAATTDVAIADFARVYGPNGVFDSFFRTHLSRYVDTSGPAWRWRNEFESVAGVPLKPFEDADRVRQVFFGLGATAPSLQFTVAADYLDTEVDRFTLTIDEQLFEYSHGPPRSIVIGWPSAAPSGVSYAFEEAGGGRPNRSFTGPWALFRLFGNARIERQSETRFLLTLTAGGRNVRLLLTAASVRNPIAQAELLRFSCGG